MPVSSRVRTEAPFLADNKLYTYNSHDRRRSLWQLQSSSSSPSGDSSSSPPISTSTTTSKAASRFGRQDYWDDFYRDNSQFSWYTGWDDLEPFLREYLQTSDSILLPGVGNDAMLRDMYDAGYQTLTAFDYAPEGIARCRDMLGEERIFVSNADDGDDNSSQERGTKPRRSVGTAFVHGRGFVGGNRRMLPSAQIALACSSARRVRTRARCSRYSTLAFRSAVGSASAAA